MVDWEIAFDHLLDQLLQIGPTADYLALSVIAEESQFIRFNHSRVRQSGQVRDGQIQLTLVQAGRTCDRTLPFTGDLITDWPRLKTALESAWAELPALPVDPFVVMPRSTHSSRDCFSGQIPDPDWLIPELLTPLSCLDSAGLYAGGRCIRAYGDGRGTRHWFETESFTLDYSLFTPADRAVKGVYAGNHWDGDQVQQQIAQAHPFLERLDQPARRLSPGTYRTYFAPAAVADLINMLSWGGIGEAALRRSGGALRALQQKQKSLSPQFTLQENFSHGLVPRFNQWGEVAPSQLPLIQAGQLVNTLISSRTAQEYGLTSNFAANGEYLRSPEVTPGDLTAANILTHLETGLYVANIHYLNWSDRPQGRITGMTRYACFWVEQGELVAPIENLRFDESLYHLLGDGLMGLTDTALCQPQIGSYGHRHLGGTWVPGLLVDRVAYTL